MGTWEKIKAIFSRDITIARAIAKRWFPTKEGFSDIVFKKGQAFFQPPKSTDQRLASYETIHFRTGDLVHAIFIVLNWKDNFELVREIRRLGIPNRFILLVLYRISKYYDDRFVVADHLRNYIASIEGKWKWGGIALSFTLGVLATVLSYYIKSTLFQ